MTTRSIHFTFSALALLLLAALLWGGVPARAEAPEAAYIVINTNDAGAGSLRQAILNANANAGPDSIGFDIPGAGVKTISPHPTG
ncbi:MAG: hypothetical protein ACRDIB_11580 [Ardenticatenaceae bacterium]